MIAILLAQAVASPQPSASPLKTIINITARPLCTALHKIVLPFAAIEKRNNDTYKSMDQELAIYRGSAGDGSMVTGTQGTYTANGVQLVQAGKIDQQAVQMAQTLTNTERQLAQSYHDIPTGTDPKLDELRVRIDNIIKLQYALASRYDAIAARTLGQSGFFPALEAGSAGGGGPRTPNYNMPGVDYSTPPPPGAVVDPPSGVKPVDKSFIIYASATDVRNTLVTHEVDFVKPALDAVNSCDSH